MNELELAGSNPGISTKCPCGHGMMYMPRYLTISDFIGSPAVCWFGPLGSRLGCALGKRIWLQTRSTAGFDSSAAC
jgi:hypothetical protein